ncbi:MAG: hypothetical protein UIC65_05610, partial [Alphaproteobacteria bacterium]|nr:hypothetical protein [Alphaproteobacteria bacterium]
SISNQRGEQLYKTAVARCKASVLNTCQAQGVDVAVITNSYDLEIDKQCIAYERALTDSNENMNRTVRNAKVVLQKARLMVAQQKNAYDLRGCVNALDSCMQDDFVCGTDYENCLDPTGKYIVNGEVVIGSAPGYFINDTEPDSFDKAAPLQHTTGLYDTWNYANTSGKNAWYTAKEGEPTSLAEYIKNSIEKKAVKEMVDNNLVRYLQYKIGYIEDNKAYGMCSSVLNKCQNYTYDGKDFKYDNAVVREYLQRTLTQIKVAHDEIISGYAENCISDVTSCLSSNNSPNPNYAINACKAQIVTCMSVNGDATVSPSPAYIRDWVKNMQSATGTKDQTTTTITYVLLDGAKYVDSYKPVTTIDFDTSLTLPGEDDIKIGATTLADCTYSGAYYWCYLSKNTSSTKCINIGSKLKSDDIADITNGKLYFSVAKDKDDCIGWWEDYEVQVDGWDKNNHLGCSATGQDLGGTCSY